MNKTEKNIITEMTKNCIVNFNRNHSKLFPNHDTNNWYWNFEYFRFNTDGSITCKASEEALNVYETQNLAVAILWENELDAQLVGEDGCTGNFDMYTPIYFPNIGLAFLVLYSISDQFARGKEVTIYGYEPSKEEVCEFIEYWSTH